MGTTVREMKLGGTVVISLILCFVSRNKAQEVVNNHEGLAKRFSMNYMDTVGNGKGLDKRYPRNFFNPSDLKRSGKYYLEESNFLKTKLPTPIKRFSMNFLDTLDNPQQKRFSMNYLDSLNNPQQKRFSMNYMDTLKNSKQKRFSMNFLDSLDHQQPRRKRFTMNFMDTLGQKGLLSKHRSSLSGHHRREENGDVSSKRSDDVVAKTKAKTVVENLDIMINYMLERYGLRVVCQSKEWHDLVDVRALLSGMVGKSGQSPTVSQCFEPNQIAEVHYLP